MAYIGANSQEFGVEPVCETMQIAPSTYYAAKARAPSARSVSDGPLPLQEAQFLGYPLMPEHDGLLAAPLTLSARSRAMPRSSALREVGLNPNYRIHEGGELLLAGSYTFDDDEV